MSNPESFIEEVTEEVRRDRLFAAFRKYGWIGVALVVLIVGGAAWNEYQKASRATAAQAFGDSLLDALDQPTPEARRAALQAASGITPEKAALQMLLLASDPETDRAGSLAALDSVIADATVPQIYRDLATLRRVILAGAEMDIAARRAALDPLGVPGRAFRTLALEQMAYLAIEAGETEAAITQLRALSTDQEAPAGLRQRALQMIVALGGKTAEG